MSMWTTAIGHPSCEGGCFHRTHVHLTRKYNGEWIAAGNALPYVLSGGGSSLVKKALSGHVGAGWGGGLCPVGWFALFFDHR
jgi:hypothetical protein